MASGGSTRIDSDRPSFWFSGEEAPRATVAPGEPVEFVTSDRAYRELNAADLDDPDFSIRGLNALTGPVVVRGAMPGDALGFEITEIMLESEVFVPYVARWRSRMFGLPVSNISRFQIDDGRVSLKTGGTLPINPMIGCLGVAPRSGRLSSLSPTATSGGNMDLREVTSGATVWFPVEIPGAFFFLGDIHAAMGRGEAVGAGLECAGAVTGSFSVASTVALAGPRIETSENIHFVGTSELDQATAEQRAVQAAWQWLTGDCGVDQVSGLAICAALLDLNFGGPAGHNVVASLSLAGLRDAGIAPRLLSNAMEQ